MAIIFRLVDLCMVPPMPNTGERLRKLREATNTSQEALGKALGKDQRWVSFRERGLTRISVDEARDIAGALGYSAELLIGKTTEGFSEALRESSPDDVAAAELFLRAIRVMEPAVREMIIEMLSSTMSKDRVG